KADALFTAALSKHGSASPSLWLNAATFHLTTLSAPSRAHALLPRAMQSLPPHTHVDLTRSFALLEYSSPRGDPERGRTLFENLLSTFPKKLDLWTVYVDAEVKKEDRERIRDLFLRVSRGKWKTKQMKFWFKKWLAWEESRGDPGGKERVEQLAAEWVRRKAEEQGKTE
ncbi:MAG: hypothetical protein Q9173_005090, partial [Seirophora scorigena]